MQILFIGRNRVLVRNELGELLTSDLTAHRWDKLPERVGSLAIARNGELWGAHGWPGHHECPSGTLWYSSDAGRKWMTRELKVPCDSHAEARNALLPGEFVNDPSDEPLLLMFNLQLMRPLPGKDVESWHAMGRPVPGVERLSRWTASGTKARDVIYVAVAERIFMSPDEGRTWTSSEVHSFSDGTIRCHLDRCFALLSQSGSEWSGLFVAARGKNDWQPVATLDGKTMRSALTRESGKFGAVESFATTSLLVDEHGVLVAGLVNAGGSAWGVVLSLSDDGQIKPVSGAVAHGLWALARAPDGELWAAGMGVHKWSNGGWITVWTDREAELAAQLGR